ncbi:indolepyruvate oxidoreductase subunit beta [Vulcanisaeta souniana]|uniref:Indolepyruvate oxidoreductase n=1 Tax=Vulcanisaeta souniana JCM 11219 TaxID=1293586 RepID=A0A830EB75_9CREN|nr:indolepyruvate oxidoreductase subunit beta [Vulcanisaeta souniana]BDR92175.1 indolepyruvate oxidoreductase [Vulcanisaeta souniana JCM 11219]GGI67347.1 indolepyruvate oxidoreductase [Vulcanisaeta souniana JCM 11219]
MRLNIYLTGVGGQGLVTFATVLGDAAIRAGYKALVAETHGLSQRGGSVDVHVRIGDIDAPLIPRGGADVIVAFEIIEAFRAVDYANEDTVFIVNRRLIRPPMIKQKIPSINELENLLRKNIRKLYVVDAYSDAAKLGNIIYENTIILGALYSILRLNQYIPQGVIEESIKMNLRRDIDKNLRAFTIGLKYGNAK